MDIKNSFEILDLHPGVSMKEATQAYRDLGRVWHPDRFLNQPRLAQKAEEKMKEINAAYMMVKSFLNSKSRHDQPDYESRRYAKYREADNDESQMTASKETTTAFYPDGHTGSTANTEGRGDEQKKPANTGTHFEALASAAELAHERLMQTKSPYRFCVYQNDGETFIDIVILDQNGNIKIIKKSNIPHQEFLTLMRHIVEGEGLLIDIEM